MGRHKRHIGTADLNITINREKDSVKYREGEQPYHGDSREVLPSLE